MKFFFRLLCCFLLFQNCTSQSSAKVNGISFVASGNETTQEHLDAVVNIHANYAAVMPFGFIQDLETPELHYNTERQWFGERADGVKQYIEMLHKNNIAVMVKPHIWIRRGEFTGYLKMNTEADWKTFEKSYLDFILVFAKLAAEMNTEMFCIGTELEQFIVARPEFWNRLISEVKKVYKGKLTYAANWDEYKRVPFWEQLDYIGVDAYFPISERKIPSVEESRAGWQRWKVEMKQISEANKKPILFTEYGYRSVAFAGKEPWVSSRKMTEVNLEAQTNLTQGLFDALYDEPWFAGGFIWKWFIEHSKVGGVENSQFTPQNKPVEKIIKSHFSGKNDK